MNRLLKSLLTVGVLLAPTVFVACDDDDDNVDVSGTTEGLIIIGEDQVRSYTFDEGYMTDTINFQTRTLWTITKANNASWLSVSSTSGKGGPARVILKVTGNATGVDRTETLQIKCGGQVEEILVTEKAGEVYILSPEDIPDYEKFFHNSEHGGDKILRSDSKFSFARYAQSEHFFVFWDSYFGDDPNGENVAEGDRVDIDDLLEKAEHFFDTNVNKLGLAVLGQGVSQLDNYKMQIYILDPTPEWWVANGGGYDNTVGALWITPSTCQPVGSTIAHEIGHSFQYQVYSDKLLQGSPDDEKSGFRYGFVGPAGEGNGGCGYWEQCAQWQAQRDYPIEQFQSYNFNVWVANCHRHFHHEWQRYASYWLPSYWVEKHGVGAYGRIWRDSKAPEDAIMSYTRLYNGNDYQATREELADYALRMATYDIADVRDYAQYKLSDYSTSLLKNDRGYYQPTYAQCPGATGFNVIPLDVPAGGGTISVDFNGLEWGATLASSDPGKMVDGDGKAVGTTTTYNKVGNAADMGWRYGFVAQVGETRYYSTIGKDRTATLSFQCPAGADHLYLVVQGSPETYYSCGWDEDESTDAQFPYEFKIDGTSITGYFDIDTTVEPKSIELTYDLAIGDATVYEQGSISLATYAICQAFALTPDVFAASILSCGSDPAEGKVAVLNKQADGSLKADNTANNGCWLDANGNIGAWTGGASYWEINGTNLVYGIHPSNYAAGNTYQLRPTLVYTKGGVQYTAAITINLK